MSISYKISIPGKTETWVSYAQILPREGDVVLVDSGTYEVDYVTFDLSYKPANTSRAFNSPAFYKEEEIVVHCKLVEAASR